MSEPYVPSEKEVRADFVALHTRNFDSYQVGRSLTSEQEYYGDQFDRFIAQVRARARCEAFQDAQQIIAGDHMVDEARERNADQVSVGHTIRELDYEIRETVVKLLRDAAHAIEQETSDGR